MLKHTYFAGLLILISSCARQSNDLHQSLQLAGHNRSELERVLQHYKEYPDDEQKYNAAEFLIANMPAYYSYDTSHLHLYRPVLPDMDSIIRVSGEAKTELGLRWDSIKRAYPLREYVYGEKKHDIQNVSASYLISDMDLSMETWLNNPYHDSLSYADFMEYVLPYRKKNGMVIEDWRGFFHTRHSDYLHTHYPLPITTVIDSLLYLYRDYSHNNFTITDFPYLTIDDLLTSNRSLCEMRCWFNVMLLSALGLPATVDCAPFWGNLHSGHTWNTILYGGTFYAFEPFWDENRWKYKQLYNNVYTGDWWGKFRLPKVYRYTYRIQPKDPAFDHRIAREDVPDLFTIPNLTDVSQQYFAVSDVKVRLTEPGDDPYSYLCVFNNNNWEPVQWAVNKRSQAIYEGMGRDILYLPAYFRSHSVIPAGEPFLLNSDGSIRQLAASDSTETITVTQTFPERPSIDRSGRSLVGGALQGANLPDFSDAIIFGSISVPDSLSIVMDVEISKPFRYVRFVFPDREVIPNRDPLHMLMAWGNIAELIFYGESGLPLDGTVMHSVDLDHQNTLKAFDGQPYTSMSPQSMDSIPQGKIVWIGRDLGKPTILSRIEILPKNEDVYLFRDATYELLYWKKGGWHSLGAQQAKTSSLTFQGVPRHALLLLKATVLPLKERPFTYENKKQIWW